MLSKGSVCLQDTGRELADPPVGGTGGWADLLIWLDGTNAGRSSSSTLPAAAGTNLMAPADEGAAMGAAESEASHEEVPAGAWPGDDSGVYIPGEVVACAGWAKPVNAGAGWAILLNACSRGIAGAGLRNELGIVDGTLSVPSLGVVGLHCLNPSERGCGSHS